VSVSKVYVILAYAKVKVVMLALIDKIGITRVE